METEELIKQCLRLSGCNSFKIEYNYSHYTPKSYRLVLLETVNDRAGVAKFCKGWDGYMIEKEMWEDMLGFIVSSIKDINFNT